MWYYYKLCNYLYLIRIYIAQIQMQHVITWFPKQKPASSHHLDIFNDKM
jgi:hypothetical protein